MTGLETSTKPPCLPTFPFLLLSLFSSPIKHFNQSTIPLRSNHLTHSRLSPHSNISHQLRWTQFLTLSSSLIFFFFSTKPFINEEICHPHSVQISHLSSSPFLQRTEMSALDAIIHAPSARLPFPQTLPPILPSLPPFLPSLPSFLLSLRSRWSSSRTS